jgi:hypothetical protein
VPRFFFHYRCAAAICRDDVGIEFADVAAAHDGAFQGAIDMWAELLRERIDPRLFSFEVTDEEGRELFTLPFGSVLKACRTEPVIATYARRAFSSARADTHRCVQELRSEVQVTAKVLRESRALMALADDLVSAWADGGQPVQDMPAREGVEDLPIRTLPPRTSRRALQ